MKEQASLFNLANISSALPLSHTLSSVLATLNPAPRTFLLVYRKCRLRKEATQQTRER